MCVCVAIIAPCQMKYEIYRCSQIKSEIYALREVSYLIILIILININ